MIVRDLVAVYYLDENVGVGLFRENLVVFLGVGLCCLDEECILFVVCYLELVLELEQVCCGGSVELYLQLLLQKICQL